MFSHVMLGANDVETSKIFYDAALGALGARSAMVDPKGRAMYMHGGGIFMLSKPIEASLLAMPMAVRLGSRPARRKRRMPFTKRASKMAGRLSKIRPDGAKVME